MAVTYGLGLAVWPAVGTAYLHAVAQALHGLWLVGLLPAGTLAMILPDTGVALVAPGHTPLGLPRGALGSDVALTVSLITCSSPLPWPRRWPHVAVGLLLAFVGHVLMTLGLFWAPGWPNVSSTGVVLWNFVSTLYHAKMLPLVVAAVVVGPTLVRRRWANVIPSTA